MMSRWITLLILFSVQVVWAHKLSDSYFHLEITDSTIQGRLDLSLRDLEFALELDTNKDLAITWGEVQARHEQLKSYIRERLEFSTGSVPALIQFQDLLAVSHTDGTYAVVIFQMGQVAAGQTLGIKYNILFDQDAQHRSILKIQHASNVYSHIFSPEHREYEVVIGSKGSSSFGLFVREGIWHIWKGIDHVLFLCALLLPAVFVRQGGVWKPLDDFSRVAVQVLKVVTSFTIAHSITLTIATLKWVEFSPRIIESIIAASVIIAALNNIFAWFREKLWSFAFLFGLVHGFGFAFVLQDLGLDPSRMFTSLLGFNIGVEIGQLAIVLALLPLCYLFRSKGFYRQVVFNGGSVVIAVIAATWMFERVFSFKVLPF